VRWLPEPHRAPRSDLDNFCLARILFSVKVNLGEKLESFVREQVKHGDYQTTSEVLREAVRRLKDAASEPAALQEAMDQAEASGFKRFDAADWEKLRGLARRGPRSRR
jgi:putative addiction module CopG family antidote